VRAIVFAAMVVGSTAVVLWVGGCESAFTWSNSSPTIEAMLANGKATTAEDPLMVMTGTKIGFLCRADDKDADSLTFTWTTPATGTSAADTATAPSNTLDWTASRAGDFTITCAVTDGRNGGAQATAYVRATPSGTNTAPTASLDVTKLAMTTGATSDVITCKAEDADQADKDTLTYQWLCTAGTIVPVTDAKEKTRYKAPADGGSYKLYCIVTDGKGGYVTAVCDVTVTKG